MWRYLVLTGLLLAGCASNVPAPVVQGSAATAIEAPPPGAVPAAAAPREGYYIVKKGDTLRHIALEHGVDYQSLAAWNNIENPSRIEIGQQLRLSAPGSAAAPADGVVVSPIAAPGQVTVIAGETVHATGGNAEKQKREPRGGAVPYSPTALAQVRAMEGAAAPGGTNAPAAETPPAAKPAEKPIEKPGATAPASTAAAPAAGGLDWAWPAPGKVIAGFAEGGGGKLSNKGIDIAGRLGDPVLAAAAGKVTYVGNLRGYGDFLVVRHSADYISVYAHAGKILVKKDQSVTKGQKIAEVGKSDADQPELHFEIRRQSKPVDPLTILPPRQ